MEKKWKMPVTCYIPSGKVISPFAKLSTELLEVLGSAKSRVPTPTYMPVQLKAVALLAMLYITTEAESHRVLQCTFPGAETKQSDVLWASTHMISQVCHLSSSSLTDCMLSLMD